MKGLGMPWEDQYGYAQAVKVDDTIFVSGQLSHDDAGNIVAAAPLDDSNKILDHSNLEAQMRQTYKNAKKILGEFAETLKKLMALPRFAHADEIAAMVAYLAGPEAGFVTGASLTIDGGFTA